MFFRDYSKRVKRNKYEITKEEEKEIKDFYHRYRKWVDLSSHIEYYNTTGIRDYRFIPDSLYYYYIDPYLSDYSISLAIEDKNYYDIWLKDFKRPATVARRIAMEYYDADYNLISEDEAIALVSAEIESLGELIAKPSLHSGSGMGIRFAKKGESIDKLFSDFGKEDFIIQRVIKQHPDMARMHKESINTIRIATLLWHGEARVLSACVRIGVDENRLDNSHQGGIGVGIMPDGRLREYGFDQYINKTTVHPQGFVFKDGKIPNYDRLVEKVIEEQKKFPHFKIINWDIAIDEEGDPVFIEFNLNQGGLYLFQHCNGPLFGDLTEQILDEILGKENDK